MAMTMKMRRLRVRGTVLMTAAAAEGVFVAVAPDLFRLDAPLTLLTVAALRSPGLTLIGAAGSTLTFDLGAVPEVDSAGLALLIDWLASATARCCQLRYVKPGKTLLALARLSEVEPLLIEAGLQSSQGEALPAEPAALPAEVLPLPGEVALPPAAAAPPTAGILPAG
jgi:ABC-type transporter Mla MlaB component